MTAIGLSGCVLKHWNVSRALSIGEIESRQFCRLHNTWVKRVKSTKVIMPTKKNVYVHTPGRSATWQRVRFPCGLQTFKTNQMKSYIFFYNGQPIPKSQFSKAVPENWESEVEDGEYSWGYYRASEIEDEIKAINENFPAFVTLENGKEKLMNNANDAYSWSKSLKSDIVKVSFFEVSEPKNYNPSNESIKESNRLTGGSDSDFVDEF